MRAIPACLTVCALLLLAAASAAGQAKLPGQGAEACTVASKAEIEKTLGVKLADGEKPPKLQTPGLCPPAITRSLMAA